MDKTFRKVVRTFFGQRDDQGEDSDQSRARNFVQFVGLARSQGFPDLAEIRALVVAAQDHRVDEVVDGLGEVSGSGNEIGRDQPVVQKPGEALDRGDQPVEPFAHGPEGVGGLK